MKRHNYKEEDIEGVIYNAKKVFTKDYLDHGIDSLFNQDKTYSIIRDVDEDGYEIELSLEIRKMVR